MNRVTMYTLTALSARRSVSVGAEPISELNCVGDKIFD